VHGEAGKSATSVRLRAPAGRFDAANGESIDTGDGRRAVSSSPGREPWTAGPKGLCNAPHDPGMCWKQFMMCLEDTWLPGN